MKSRSGKLLTGILFLITTLTQAQDLTYDTIIVVVKGKDPAFPSQLSTGEKPEKYRRYIAGRQPPAGIYTVCVRYIIDKQGNTSEIVAESKCGYGMEDEAVRRLKKSPRWEPAPQDQTNKIKRYGRRFTTFIISHPGFDIRCAGQYVLSYDTANEITVTTTRWKLSRLRLIVAGKKIRPSREGRFMITPEVNPGERIIISLRRAGKKKKLGEASFEVKKNG